MNLLQDRNFKLKYQKCKYKVKVWETEFKKKNGHNPTKDDIREAPSHVREAYKMYYNMKTKMLEELDILISEEVLSPTNADLKSDSISGGHIKTGENDKTEMHRVALADIQNCPESTDVNVPQKKPVAKEEIIDQKSLNENDIWGVHLNVNKTPCEKKSAGLQRSFSSTFAEKLAKGAQFCKRNPRKSLSSRSSKNFKPGLFNTLSQDCLSESVSVSNISYSQESITDSVSLSCSLPLETPNLEKETCSSLSFSSQLQSLKCISEKKTMHNRPLSIVQKAATSNSINVVKRNVDKGWLERCSGNSVREKWSFINDNAVDMSWDTSVKETDVRQSVLNESALSKLGECDDIGSDEEIIYSSDTESSQSRFTLKRKSSCLSLSSESTFENIAKKRKANEDDCFDALSLIKSDSFVEQAQSSCTKGNSVIGPEETVRKPNNSNEALADNPIDNLSQETIGDLVDHMVEKSVFNKRKKKDPQQKLTKKEMFEKKMASGQANENFVKVNLKKKVYVRGKKTMTYAKHKKLQWKANKRSAALSEDTINESGVRKCYKCGDVGHFARNCLKDTGDKLMPESEDEEDSQFPTLEEAAAMAASCNIPAQRIPAQAPQSFSQGTSSGHTGVKVPDYVLESLRQEEEKKLLDPIYPLGDDGNPMAPTEEVYSVLREFGHTEFREGQGEAIMRILSGLSTLVTLSTGSGKSLCYQLPALIYARHYKCITLVVSPLVSLMEDQVAGLPNCVKIACLHYNQTESQRKEIMEKAKAGELHTLLVSPEAIMSGEKSRSFGSIIRDLPPIAFACIDEAHCLSQWSHNFRPSYLMISEVLRSKLHVKTFLGLTATATFSTCRSILEHLQIPNDGKGVIKNVPLPDNLVLTASCDRRRDDALLTLLSGSRFASCDSIIVYCIRRTECERLAVLLRTCLQEGKRPEENKIRCRVSTNAEAYHAGLTAARRRLVQKRFMSGKTRIVVATIAFGMGIDKKDIRAIIHYNMPRNFENYVQEVGRAGRDGLPAHCHLFLDPDGADLQELSRHIFANSVDRHVIRKLLQRVFVPCRCNRLKKLAESSYAETNEKESFSVNSPVKCPGHEVAFKINETVQALDIPEENIATMLCYLELHPKKWLKVLPPTYTMCKVQSYGGPKAFRTAAKNSPPLAMAIALDQRQGITHENSNKIEFPVVDVAAALNWDSGIMKSHLKSLEWNNLVGKWKRTRICVEFQELGFRVLAPGMLPPDELDEALDVLYERVDSQERACLLQLQYAFDSFKSVAYKSCIECMDTSEESRSYNLKKQIREYFELQSLNVDMKIKETLLHEEQVIADTRQLVCSYPDTTFTGRAVARIFHGIESPCFPARSWGRCRYWRAHLNEDFKLLVKVATREILFLR